MTAVASPCAHCGLPVGRFPEHREIDGVEHAFCCYGCCLTYQLCHHGAREEPETAAQLIRLGVGAFLAMNVMLFSLLLYADGLVGDAGAPTGLIHWVLLGLATPLLGILGTPFLRAACDAAAQGRLTADTLVCIGTMAAYGYSAFGVVAGTGDVYFDTAAMVLVLFTLGRYLEAQGRMRAMRSLAPMLAGEQASVAVVGADGESCRPVVTVQIGDRVRIRPGERIAVDGRVVAGRSECDESILTGQPQPCPKCEGDEVIAGSLNGMGELVVCATAPGSDTRWVHIGRLVREALGRKSALGETVDRVAAWFVPGVLVLALGTGAYWAGEVGAGPALLAGLAVLVVACPCALGLAAPLATSLGIGRAAEHGILVRGGAVLERLARLRVVAFDKTGTLTIGRPVTAWRNILRAKGFSLLNIAGLAVGLAVCLLILLYVRAETSYDAYHQHVDRIYRVQNASLKPDGSIGGEFATLAPSFAILLRNDLPEIERLARTWNPSGTVVRAGDKTFTEERFHFAEPEVFDILTLPFIQGDPATALNDVGGIVLSRSTARRYFGDADPMGRILVLPSRNNMEFRVTGVMEDVPRLSHIHFDLLASYITLKGLSGSGDADYFHGTRNFSDNVTSVYVRLASPGGGPALQAKIPAFLDSHFPAQKDDQGRLNKVSELMTLHVQKVKDIHLYAHTRSDFEPAGDIRTVRLFTIIALFILAIACVNFVNLSTARGVKRAREVGLRKVVGAARRTLAAQFLGESFLITFLALLLAVGLVLIALPAYGRFVGHAFDAGALFSPAGVGLLAAGFLLTGLAAGVYPALYLAAFRPSIILRGELTRGKGGAALRKSLVVFQFAISIALIFSVTVIARQTRFLRTADIGYARNNIICVPVEPAVSRRWTDMKAALLREPSILATTLSKRAPSGRLLDSPGFWAEVDGNRIQSAFGMPHNRVEQDFFRTYGMTLVAGRDFSLDIPTDAAEAFILNETAVRRLGFKSPEAAVGASFGTFAPNRNGRVIGVVRDFNYESMHQAIVPIVTYVAPNQANTLSLRIAPGSLAKVVLQVQTVFDSIHPAGPVRYDFLSERLAALYRGEERSMKMFFFFSLLAVAVGCLGLFGLASFSAERRTKEIGVRKILGASAPALAGLLSREFTKWVVVANLIAWPVAYFAAKQWLQGFAYRAPIGAAPFALSAALALTVALLTVSYQAVRAALADPVKALRYE